MHVGYNAAFQNPHDALGDEAVYENELRLCDLAVELGFESLWTVEHHFDDYTMCPDPVQWLSYMAGKHPDVLLGSGVIVLPWHDPLRVAEQVTMLDNLSDGRLILGLGRGAGRVEFDGFRQDMGDSRPRFVESAECLLAGLEQGYCEYQGQYVKQPRVDIRPSPFRTFRGRTYAAAVSPESLPIMAKLGVGILIVPQKPWDAVEKEVAEYKKIYREVNGEDPPAPIVAGWTFCDPDKDRAYELAKRYIGGYWESVLKHYQFASDHLKGQKGYEYYGKFAENLQTRGADAAIEFFLGLQIWGDPETCYRKIVANAERIGAESYVGVFSYAGMPAAETQRSMRLFADSVLPKLKGDRPKADHGRAAARL